MGTTRKIKMGRWKWDERKLNGRGTLATNINAESQWRENIRDFSVEKHLRSFSFCIYVCERARARVAIFISKIKKFCKTISDTPMCTRSKALIHKLDYSISPHFDFGYSFRFNLFRNNFMFHFRISLLVLITHQITNV